MSDVYLNRSVDLVNTNLTTLYTIPAETTAIIKSIHVANVDTSNDCDEFYCQLSDSGDVCENNSE